MNKQISQANNKYVREPRDGELLGIIIMVHTQSTYTHTHESVLDANAIDHILCDVVILSQCCLYDFFFVEQLSRVSL